MGGAEDEILLNSKQAGTTSQKRFSRGAPRRTDGDATAVQKK